MDEKRKESARKVGGSEWWREAILGNKIVVILGLVGVLLISLGFLGLLALGPREPTIEILPAEEVAEEATLFVHLEGAIEKPGVYELPVEARVNDLLIRAGGLSAEADRDWVAKNLNLAQKLSDGVKIYIPSKEEDVSLINETVTSGEVSGAQSVTGKVNINTASASELDSLWGIGEKRAADIIANRPYTSVEELLTKKIIPSNVYERIKEEISVF
jgi:competence protein ComEA